MSDRAASAFAERHDAFTEQAADMDRRLSSALHDNAQRRATLLDVLGTHPAPNDYFARLADVSPLLTGPAAGLGYPGMYQHQQHHQQQQQTRRDLLDYAAAMPHGGGAGSYRDPLATSPSPMLTSSEAVERAVQSAVAREMRNQEERMVELIAREWDRRAQELEHALRGRFTDLQVLHESSTRLLREVGAGLGAQKAEAKAEIDRIDVALAALGQELRGKLTELGRASNRDITSVREIALEVQSRFAVDTSEYSRRVETMQRRAAEAYADAMNAVESRVAALRAESEAGLRDLKKSLRDDVDNAGRIAADCKAYVTRGDDEMRRMSARVGELLEDAASKRSELRMLRDDVRQMELYMKGRIDRIAAGAGRTALAGTLAAAVARPAKSRHAGDEAAAPAGVDELQMVNVFEIQRLQSDVFLMTQAIADLAGRLRAFGMLEDDDDITALVSPTGRGAGAEPSSANFVLSALSQQAPETSRARDGAEVAQQKREAARPRPVSQDVSLRESHRSYLSHDPFERQSAAAESPSKKPHRSPSGRSTTSGGSDVSNSKLAHSAID
jgi:hypothetical protein